MGFFQMFAKFDGLGLSDEWIPQWQKTTLIKGYKYDDVKATIQTFWASKFRMQVSINRYSDLNMQIIETILFSHLGLIQKKKKRWVGVILRCRNYSKHEMMNALQCYIYKKKWCWPHLEQIIYYSFNYKFKFKSIPINLWHQYIYSPICDFKSE